MNNKLGDLWILNHPDLRKNAKIQSFVRFMTEYVHAKKELIEGRAANVQP